MPLLQVFPGDLPSINFQHILYSYAIFKQTISELSSTCDLTNALAVAICITVSSLYLKFYLLILSLLGPLPSVNFIIC